MGRGEFVWKPFSISYGVICLHHLYPESSRVCFNYILQYILATAPVSHPVESVIYHVTPLPEDVNEK